MKKLSLSLLGLFLFLSATILFMGCEEEKEKDNPFIGTWENENTGYRINFTKDVITGYYPNGDTYYQGTYTYNDANIIIQVDTDISAEDIVDSWGNAHIATYSFINGNLIFNHSQLKKID